MKPQRRSKPKDGPKTGRGKPSVLVQERIDYVDYKDVALLERCVSDRSKIRARRASGHDSKQQREIERAVKNAREMALLPYAKRVESGVRSRGSRRVESGQALTENAGETAPTDVIEETE
jgi:small subunit ribosomal protein S18